ncbi:Protein kinase domain-containing protein [Mycena indigotica]|uniref:non-specific serine/threonine protein kinase n=1 Tax=Mycena indigotica TaxID=2126181 RepID=A0A8H6SC98_9AGAR|nr:Protein kinase domain-containing protein [Mycena indigotica]KAF7296900.1 Protein kinase domain-containing protein [Mycena indigotica]
MPSQFCASRSLPNFTGTVLDKNLKLVAVLGTGAFGKVYKAIDLDSPADCPTFYAVKCLRLQPVGSHQRQQQEQEIRYHLAVAEDPRVVSLHRYFTSGEYLFVVLDYAETDVLEVLANEKVFHRRPDRVKEAFGEILDGVEALHRQGIYHRDIKPDNLLCDSDGKNIRIADFGLSTKKIRSLLLGCGSPGYMCPESLERSHPTALEGYSPKDNDIWAVAVLFCNFVAGVMPWQKALVSDPAFKHFIHHEDHLIHDLGLTKETNALLRRCFHKNPQMRPTLAEFRSAINAMERFTLADPLPSSTNAVTSNKQPMEGGSSSSSSRRSDGSEEEYSTPPTSCMPSSPSQSQADASARHAPKSGRTRRFPRRLFKAKGKHTPSPSPEPNTPAVQIERRKRRSSLQLLAKNLGLSW